MTMVVIVQWCHIAAAILWAGGAALSEIVLRPALNRLPRETERSIGQALTPAMTWYFAITGTLTIVFGILRGTLFGPLQSLSAFFTPFGITWCVALLLAAALALIGALGVGRAATLIYRTNRQIRNDSEDRARRSLAIYGPLQVVGFLLILLCMVLMSEVFG